MFLYSDRRRRKILSNQNESSLDKEKQPDPKVKVERKEGEPTAAFKGLPGQHC